MTLRSTGRLARSDFNKAGNASKVCKERSSPTTGPLDNMGSLLVKILVEREERRW